MRRIIYITILGIIFSCNSNKKLEGTWIGAYSYSDEVESSINFPVRTIVTFEDNRYLSRSFFYDYRSERNIEKGTFNFNGRKIIYDSNDEKHNIIHLLNNDSLITKGTSGANNTVFKKLDDSLRNRSEDINLIGKSFLIKSGEYADTLSFLNDSLLVVSSDKSRNPGSKWERIKHNKFDIIFMEMNVPLLIQEKIEDTIYMTGLHENVLKFKLVELKRMPTAINEANMRYSKNQ